MNLRKLALLAFCTILLVSCTNSDCSCVNSDSNRNPDIDPITSGAWWKPDLQTTWQWQLQGALDTTVHADMYDVDMEYTPHEMISALQLSGRKVVCYFSAGSWENYRDDVKTLDEAYLGSTLDGWPEERWWDISSDAVRNILRARLDSAKVKGCDGVEADNVDGYQNENGIDLDSIGQLAFNRWLANEAHKRGLAIALKNDINQIPELVAYYDFAVNEQCHEYEECDTYEPFITAGKPVFNAEYQSKWTDSESNRASLCATARTEKLQTLVLPILLDGSFRYDCGE